MNTLDIFVELLQARGQHVQSSLVEMYWRFSGKYCFHLQVHYSSPGGIYENYDLLEYEVG